jgi:hypothetical protein
MAIEGLSIRPYLDHNFDMEIGLAVRRLGFDTVLAKEVGNERLSDEAQLEWASRHRRTLITYDRDDFPMLHYQWVSRGQVHAGIIVSLAPPRLPFREILVRLLNVLNNVTGEEMTNRLLWLDDSWSYRG